MSDKPKLPPLDKEALDGESEEAKIHRDEPMLKVCNHRGIQLVSSTEIKCPCGAGWTGPDIQRLYELFKEQA